MPTPKLEIEDTNAALVRMLNHEQDNLGYREGE